MATSFTFNTARVAGEGITLAIVSAVLAALVQSSLLRMVPSADASASVRIADAAQQLTTGGMEAARNLVPEVTTR